eukprot:NODE_705_length_1247_cov_123.179464_g666_i0.p1 GENE.NODE_705_length_1247_cov_123.179464_g666_i0~~NODE_705_length_1247_cov_123.179464_g666_i0.p1  ORF type:complete len:350 (-),score=38.07 NODE_705_length_1247_cov_123.179464_g666_i0:54-1103(-)
MGPPTAGSKYDFVKVKVNLGTHPYVLSRFILSRILTVIQVKSSDAVQISLALKKKFVDANQIIVEHDVLVQELLAIMQSHGYGELYKIRYHVLTRFHHERVPLLVLLAGAPITGKSTLATKLAEVLNIPNLLSTDMLAELTAALGHTKHAAPWFETTDKEQLLKEFRTNCADIRQRINGDVDKCFGEGKAFIIEGSYLDPITLGDLADKCLVKPAEGDGVIFSGVDLQLLTKAQPDRKAKTEGPKKGIVVPVLLELAPTEHNLFVDHWVACAPSDSLQALGTSSELAQSNLFANLRTLHEYLDGQCRSVQDTFPFVRVPLDLRDIGATASRIHDQVLRCIESAFLAGTF